MANLHFYYSTMNAGKSTALLQASYNYEEQGMNTLLFAPEFDDRYGSAKISSRIGIQSDANLYNSNTDLYKFVCDNSRAKTTHGVLIDEAQFLTKKQVSQLTDIVDKCNIPVMAYGLRNDFQAEPFEGSKYLLAWSDRLIELKTICHCGKKATHVLRVDENNIVTKSGDQIQIGGKECYIVVCRKHFKNETIKSR